MVIEYKIRFEGDSVTVTQRVEPGGSAGHRIPRQAVDRLSTEGVLRKKNALGRSAAEGTLNAVTKGASGGDAGGGDTGKLDAGGGDTGKLDAGGGDTGKLDAGGGPPSNGTGAVIVFGPIILHLGTDEDLGGGDTDKPETGASS